MEHMVPTSPSPEGGGGPETWRLLMRARISGQESGVPWNVVGKLGMRDFCRMVGLPAVPLLGAFASVEAIPWHEFPDRFVVKSSASSSSKQVALLCSIGSSSWRDLTRHRDFDRDSLTNLIRGWLAGPPSPRRALLVERYVNDELASGPIPRDYKFYCFQGQIALILVIDRNSSPPRVAWFDDHFEPLTESAVRTNTKFAAPAELSLPGEAQVLCDLARRASICLPTPFVSVDLFLSSSLGPRVGELTLTPGGIYYGQHYELSDHFDKEMGRMWIEARARLQLDSGGLVA